MKSLIFQLARCGGASRQILFDAYLEADNGGRALDYDELKECLKSLLTLYESIYIVLDALDECSERGDVFDFLEELHGWEIPGVRVLLSSKTMEEIGEALKPLYLAKVHIQNSLVDKDIRKHVAFQLSNNRDFRRWDATDKAEIVDKLSNSSDGMQVFLGIISSSLKSLIRSQLPMDRCTTR